MLIMHNPHQLSLNTTFEAKSTLRAPLKSPLGSREIAVESGAHRLGPRDGNCQNAPNAPNGHENRPEEPLVIR